MPPLPPDSGGVSLVPSESSVPLASSGSVPLVPLPARALRAYQRHVGAVWAAWPALDGPGQPAREGCARRPTPDPVHVASEVRAFRHRAPADGRRRGEGRGWGAGRVIVCIAALGRVTLCDRRRCCALFAKTFVLEEMVEAYIAVFSLIISLAS